MTRPIACLFRALCACVALAACAKPPPEAYIGGSQAVVTLDLGPNSARESCTLQRGSDGQRGSSDVQQGSGDGQIYCGRYLEPAGQVVRQEQAADPANFLTASPWRTAFDSRFVCGSPGQTTVLDSPAAILSCTQRDGGWPHVVLAARIGGTLYVADGVKPVESVLPRAIGVMSGKLPATPATVAERGGFTTQREAAEAVDIQGAGAFAEVEQEIVRGSLENRLGNDAAAEAAYYTAVSIQERVVGLNNPGLAVLLARQALQVSNQGRFAEADRLFARAERLVALPDQIDPVARPQVAELRALDQLNRGKFQDALALLDQADRGFSAILPPDVLVPRDRTASGPPSAVQRMAQAAADSALLADLSVRNALYGLIESHRDRAIALTALGRTQEADAALRAARDLYIGRDPRLAPRYFRTAGMTASAENDASAISDLGQAEDMFARVQPGSLPLAETQLLHAQRLASQGDYTAALSECRAAAQTLQSLQSGVPPNLLVPCLHALSTTAAAGGQSVPVEMFAMAQLAQGSITSQQIARATVRLAEGARDPKVAQAIDQYDAATTRLDALYRRRADLAADKDSAAAVAAMDVEIRKAQDAKRDAGQARQAALPGYSALVQESVSTGDVQALLQPTEAVASIVLGDDEGWTLLVRKDGVTAGRIEGGAKRVDASVKRFRASMELSRDNTPAPFDAAAAHDLYAAVLGPVSGALAGVDTLTVAPSGSLLSVPFGALLTEPMSGGDLSRAPFLIRKMAVSHVPSAASFVNLRQAAKTVQANRPWFGMGGFRAPSLRQATANFPVDTCGDSARLLADLPPLPGALKQLEVARRLLGANVNEELLGAAFTAHNVLAAPLQNYRVLHFATHAVLPDELRCQAEPAVLTSTSATAPDATGALLTASQIEDMRLDADLVILAACNTGGANGGGATGGGAGESLSGLARSFFFAGARSLLVTHWEANDVTTTYLTALFLQALQSNPDAGPAAALAASQRRMLDESVGPLAVQAHPYYWAVEALIGGRGAKGGSKVANTGRATGG